MCPFNTIFPKTPTCAASYSGCNVMYGYSKFPHTPYLWNCSDWDCTVDSAKSLARLRSWSGVIDARSFLSMVWSTYQEYMMKTNCQMTFCHFVDSNIISDYKRLTAIDSLLEWIRVFVDTRRRNIYSPWARLVGHDSPIQERSQQLDRVLSDICLWCLLISCSERGQCVNLHLRKEAHHARRMAQHPLAVLYTNEVMCKCQISVTTKFISFKSVQDK